MNENYSTIRFLFKILQFKEGSTRLKINQSVGMNPERFLPQREKSKEIPSFEKFLQEKQFDLTKDRLKSLLNDLNQHETRLTVSQSMQDLIAYKQTIRDFIKEVVQNGISLEEHQGHHPNGREKRLKLIKQVDRKLLELSDQILEKHAPTVELLQKMGEIKGLLVNMYF